MKFLMVACVVICGFAVSMARIGPTSLFELTAESSVIVVAEVTQVIDRAGVRIGVAKVTRAVTGAKEGDVIEFVASPTWTCDESYCEIGETVILYLSPVSDNAGISRSGLDLGSVRKDCAADGKPLYRIGHHGSGRIVIQGESAEQWCSVEIPKYNEDWRIRYLVELPPTFKMFDVQDGENQGSKMVAKVRVEDLLSYSRGILTMLKLSAWLHKFVPEKPGEPTYTRFCRTRPTVQR